MRTFLEQYGIAIFTLVVIAILLAFAGPLGIVLKQATNTQIANVDKIGVNEIAITSGGTVRPPRPQTATDQVWCYIDKDGELVISQEKITASDDALVKEIQVHNPSDIISDSSQIKTARFEGAVMPKNCNNWFNSCNNLTKIKNMENLYMNECTSMSRMFYGCKSLTNLDIKLFDTSNVIDMNGLFCGCRNLINLNIDNWNTSVCTNMYGMFSGCNSLRTLNISSLNTSKCINMACMFFECNSLTSLDLSGFDTSACTDIYAMFKGCKLLTYLNISSFNTSKCKSMVSMFEYCENLKNLDITDFDTSQCTNMNYMFCGCYNLTVNCATWNVLNVTTHEFFRSSINVKEPIWNN